MSSLFDFLKVIIDKPGMFKVSKVEDIEFVILGYTYVDYRHSQDKTAGLFFEYYREYVSRRFGVSKLSKLGWCKIIRLFSASDQHSLQIFQETFTDAYSSFNKKQRPGKKTPGVNTKKRSAR